MRRSLAEDVEGDAKVDGENNREKAEKFAEALAEMALAETCRSGTRR